MCLKAINFDIIRLVALLDLILTVLTVVLALHIYNLNSELVETEKEKYNKLKYQNPEIGPPKIYGVGKKTAKGLVYCFIIAPLLILLVNASIVCCGCCTEDPQMIYQMLKLLIAMECCFLLGMTILYLELYSYVVADHENVIEGPEIRIPYAICYVSRVIVILVFIIKLIMYKKQGGVPTVADIEIP